MSTEALLVLTTCGNAEQADQLAKALVTKRLAACVSRVDGIVSTYRWESKLQQDREVLVLIKTTRECLDAIEASINDQTDYDLPEILAVCVDSGSAEYLKWLAAAVSPGE